MKEKERDLFPSVRRVVHTIVGSCPFHEVREAPMLYPGNRELLIKVSAIGVNRADIEQSMGHYPPPFGASEVLGLEVSGEVVDVGEEVSHFSKGDRVMSLLQGGGYATYVLAPEETSIIIPNDVSYESAAALPEAWFTIWYNLIKLGKLKAHDTVLIHRGSGGVGIMAIQMAKVFGAKVITTVRNIAKAQVVTEVGADRAILYPEEDFAKAVMQMTKNTGVDLILDLVGKDDLDRNLKILKRGGRLVLIDSHSGDWGNIDLGHLITHNLTVMGSVLRPLTIKKKAELSKEIQNQLLPLLKTGKLCSKIHACFPLEDVDQAHALLLSNNHIGKIILSINDIDRK